MYIFCDLGFILLVFLNIKLTKTTSIEQNLATYEQYVNTSLQIERQDKVNINTWCEELQVQLVNVTTKYRLQMTRHQQHSFKNRTKNKKWQNCLKLYENTTTKLEQVYYIKENNCLKSASSADGDKRQAVMQVGKEIRKWRRTYRYLTNICHKNHLGDEDQFGICLVQYMERDNFSYAFERLLNLRLEAVQKLHQEMMKAVVQLEECLKTTLSEYLEQVRVTMDALSRCYEIVNSRKSGMESER